MNNMNWDDLLGIKPYGLAVEGKNDEIIIQRFLDMGGKSGHWQSWDARLVVKQVEGKANVFAEIEKNEPRIWGLIDRDAYSSTQIDDLQAKYPRLLVLPRWTIENYFIVPDELALLFPNIQPSIEAHRANWVKHGALWHVLQEQGVFEEDYPRKLFDVPIRNDDEIHALLHRWRNQIDPDKVLTTYSETRQQFSINNDKDYTQHIHGKTFFGAIVKPLIDSHIKPNLSKDKLKEKLVEQFRDCPADLVPILRRVMN